MNQNWPGKDPAAELDLDLVLNSLFVDLFILVFSTESFHLKLHCTFLSTERVRVRTRTSKLSHLENPESHQILDLWLVWVFTEQS